MSQGRGILRHPLEFWGILRQSLVRIDPAKAFAPPLPSSSPPAVSCCLAVWTRADRQTAGISRAREMGFRDPAAGLAAGWGDCGCCGVS